MLEKGLLAGIDMLETAQYTCVLNTCGSVVTLSKVPTKRVSGVNNGR